MADQQVNLQRVDGFPYAVTDTGLVYSLPRVVVRTNGRPYTVVKRKLTPTWNGDHLQVRLKVDGNTFVRFVHHLVLEAFVGPRPEGMRGLHRDDNPFNNSVGNLYWGTAQDNAFDRVRNGNDHNARKARCKRGHLLLGDNLAPWAGNRCCVSCNRALGLARYRGCLDEAYIQRLSDEKYVLTVIGGEAHE